MTLMPPYGTPQGLWGWDGTEDGGHHGWGPNELGLTDRAGTQEDQQDGQTRNHMVARDGDVQHWGNNDQNKTMVSRGRWTEDGVVDKLPTGPIDLLVVLFLAGQNGNGVVASKALLQIPYQNRHDHQQQEEHHQDRVGGGIQMGLHWNQEAL